MQKSHGGSGNEAAKEVELKQEKVIIIIRVIITIIRTALKAELELKSEKKN